MVFIILTFLSALWVFGFSFIVEWVLIKRIMDNAATGLTVSLLISFLLLFGPVLYSTGLSSLVGVPVIAGFLIAITLSYPSYRRRKKKQDEIGKIFE